MYEDMTYDVIMKRMINTVLQNNPGLTPGKGRSSGSRSLRRQSSYKTPICVGYCVE